MSKTHRWRTIRVPMNDPRAEELRQAMNEEIGPRYADRENGDLSRLEGRTDHPAGHITESSIIATVLVLNEAETVGHGILRDLDGTPEVKRLYVKPSARGTGAAGVLLKGLEDAAVVTGASRVILQTGDRQPEAEALYRKHGWHRIPIYPPYLAAEFSRCYEKTLPAAS